MVGLRAHPAPLLALSLAAILVAACGSSAGSASPVATVAGSTATSAAIATPTPTPTPVPTPTPLPRAAWTHGQDVVDARLTAAGTGWVLTNNALWQTIDDGATWANTTPAGMTITYTPDPDVPHPNRSNVRGLGALDASNAYVATITDTSTTLTVTVWRTRDGGQSWTSTAMAPQGHTSGSEMCGTCTNFQPQITFDVIDSDTAFMYYYLTAPIDEVDNLIFVTHDGGATWTKLDFTPDSLLGSPSTARVQFMTATAGVAEYENRMYSTTTGWGTWTQRTLGSTDFRLPTVYFLSAGDWAAQEGLSYGTHTYNFAVSHDQGHTWVNHTNTLPAVPGENDAALVPFTSTSWVVTIGTPTSGGYDTLGTSYTYATTDAGSHWASEGPQPFHGSRAVFIDPSHGWTFSTTEGSVGKLWTTADGGHSWSLLTP